MQAINYPRTYAQTGEIAAYRPVRRPDRTLPIQVTGGKFTIGGERFPLNIASFVEGSAVPKVDAEIVETIKRVISDGHNGIFLRAFNGRQWNESAYNWGVWAYAHDDPDAAHRWELSETALAQLDKMIAWSLDLGLECVYLDFTGYDENIVRHPSLRPYGSYFSQGMQWSSEARQMMWDANSRIALRVSTITGTRHIDNPRIIWKFFNENGFSDEYRRSGTVTWSGGTNSRFERIISNIDDPTPTYSGMPVNNGYWLTELNAKLFAWAAANRPSWVIPNWGVGGSQGMPTRATWYTWASGADPTTDKNNIIDFLDAMDVEATADIIRRVRAHNPLAVINTGTFSYVSLNAHFALPEDCRGNLFTESHQYFSDNASTGVKLGTSTSRRSVQDNSWNLTLSGYGDSGWYPHTVGVRSSEVGFLNSECGQYGPNRWRYQRPAYEFILATLHGYDYADFSQSQQYLTNQFKCDGRYMGGDNANVASPAIRLANRAFSAIHRFQMFDEHSSSFTIQATDASIKAYQHSNVVVAVQGGGQLINNGSDGSAHAIWGTKKVFIEVDPTNTATPTTDNTAIRISDASLASGVYLRNTATEKIYLKRPEGMQLMSPYCCGFIDTLREKAAADAIFAMPMYLSSMSASVNCAVCFLRSDGLWPLFTGPMKLYIHGSDFSDEVVLQGSDYAQHVADALGPHDPPGAAYFMANDQVQVWYSASNSQSWGNNSGSASTVRLMMPEPFTLNLITPVDLEIFGVTKDGIPVRIASTYAGGIWSFNYDGTYPEYIVQPKVTNNVLSHLETE